MKLASNGSVVFQVFLDGVMVFTSGTMTGASPTQSIDLNVTGKTTLRLVVADGGNGNAFDHADWASARLVAGEPVAVPSAPTNLQATLNSAQVDVSWTDSSSDETGFRVQRKLGLIGAWINVATLGANVQSWTDSGPLAGSSTYFYRVVAFNAGGDSTPSNESSITTPQASAQTWLSDLSWTTATNGWGAVRARPQ